MMLRNDEVTPSQETIDLIEKLVGFDTTSHKSNLELISFIADYLGKYGIGANLIEDPSGTKANLFATIGPEDRPGIVLSGHTDVVPVDGQNWASDPFTMTRIEDRLYGRGTADMKSFIAATLAQVPHFLAADLQSPVHLAFSYDEEIGCVGVHSLIEDLAHRPVRPLACIVGEPTGMSVINAHKGKVTLTCTVTGKAAHSSQTHKAANAVEAASRLVVFLSDMAQRQRDEGPYLDDMDPPFTTVHVGPIHGGEALNIVPSQCGFEFEIRYLPGHDYSLLIEDVRRFAEDEILPKLRAVAEEVAINWEQTSLIVALDESEDSPAVALAKSLTGANKTGKVAFGTEAGLFSGIEIPTVVCGPGSIDQAHKPNEFISFDQIAKCELFLGRLTNRLTGDLLIPSA